MLGKVLAAAGSTTLVGAMATDVWHTTRSEMAQLFGRGRPARQQRYEAQLDGNAALVAQAENPDEVRQRLVPVWQQQLEMLLHRYPDAAGELRTLVARVQVALPATQQAWVHTYLAGNQALSH